jgi:hypothetical protein
MLLDHAEPLAGPANPLTLVGAYAIREESRPIEFNSLAVPASIIPLA